jgi:hypothetical protein
MAAFQFYLQPGKQRKVGWRGDDSHVVFSKKFPDEKGSMRWYIVSQKFPDEKGSMRWYIVIMQQPLILSLKFGAKSLHIFM